MFVFGFENQWSTDARVCAYCVCASAYVRPLSSIFEFNNISNRSIQTQSLQSLSIIIYICMPTLFHYIINFEGKTKTKTNQYRPSASLDRVACVMTGLLYEAWKIEEMSAIKTTGVRPQSTPQYLQSPTLYFTILRFKRNLPICSKPMAIAIFVAKWLLLPMPFLFGS